MGTHDHCLLAIEEACTGRIQRLDQAASRIEKLFLYQIDLALELFNGYRELADQPVDSETHEPIFPTTDSVLDFLAACQIELPVTRGTKLSIKHAPATILRRYEACTNVIRLLTYLHQEVAARIKKG